MINRMLLIGFLIFAYSMAAFSQSESRIRIPKGIGTIHYKGSVEKHRKTYVFVMRAGQKVDFSVTSKNPAIVFEAFYYPKGEEFGTPLTTETKSWTGTLPQATKYSVDVYTSDGSRANYKFTIQVK